VTAGRERPSVDLWVRRVSALVVAGVAAYASYEHQRRFALAGGADQAGARLWPASVDGLVLLATVGLLRADQRTGRRSRWALWVAFGLRIVVSLAANIAAAPVLGWQPVLVAGWPPVALLLAVELLAHHPTRPAAAETSESPAGEPATSLDIAETVETLDACDTADESEPVITLAGRTNGTRRDDGRKAEEIMWIYLQRERASGRMPTGAELDRVAGTNNYGRAVLARWRRTGRLVNLAVRQDDVERRSALVDAAAGGNAV